MKRTSLGTLAAAVASLGMMLPPPTFAAVPIAPTSDVALRAGGLLVGQVIDAQGVAQAKKVVSIRQGKHEVVRTTTDKNGVFAAQGLRGGQYDVVTQDGGCTCRLWAADTAPPAARQAALVVSGGDVVRGQFGPANSWVAWIKAHPYITAGTVAAAVAVPIAFMDDDFDNGS
ncbi:MAG: carboxypeptidase-like regulatory domain-containing protein [Pirellulales bacterium]